MNDLPNRRTDAQRALHPSTEMPHSRLKESIAGLLKSEGYITDFAVEGQGLKKLKLKLKYVGKRSVIEGLRRVSSPGLRRYVGAGEIPRVRAGMGVAVLSTSQGVMSGHQAKKNNLGGELICYVW